MFFEEPRVEFVEIEMIDTALTSIGGGEDCNGTGAPANNCAPGAYWIPAK